MNRVSSIFSQLLQFFPRLEFESLARDHNAERHARGFTCWQQFVAMMFCQLAYAQSLREICGGLTALEGKLRHLGVMDCPKATTLSYANAHRPWHLYEALLYQTLARCQTETSMSRQSQAWETFDRQRRTYVGAPPDNPGARIALKDAL